MDDITWIGLAALFAIGAFFVLRRPSEPAASPAPKGPVGARALVEAPLPQPKIKERPLAKLTFEEDDDEITLLNPQRNAMSGFLEEAPGAKPTAFLIDEDAAIDEPTGPMAMILVYGAAQTDAGKTRKDSFLVLEETNLFVVADGMGGYAGGDVASRLAVETVEATFRSKTFPGEPFEALPPRASELVQAVEAANAAIYAQAERDPTYRGMGTTIVAARFSPRKQRLYVAHVGDSRCYRLRDDELVQVTVDHTMAAAGVQGPGAERLMRALGIGRTVDVDLLVAKPRSGDVYLMCTDGLSKMASFDELGAILRTRRDPNEAVKDFVHLANKNGGKDNITVVVVRIDPKN